MGTASRASAAAAVAIISPTRAAPRWSAAKPRYWTWTCTSAQSRSGRLRPGNHDGGIAPWARRVAQVESGGGDAGVAPVDAASSPEHVAAVGVAVDERARHPGQRAGDRGIGPPGQQRALGVGELPLPRAREPAAAHGDQRAVAQRRPPRRVDDGHAARPSTRASARAPWRGCATPARAPGRRARAAARRRTAAPASPGRSPTGAGGPSTTATARMAATSTGPAALSTTVRGRPPTVKLHPLDRGGHVPAGQRRAADHPHRRTQAPFEAGSQARPAPHRRHRQRRRISAISWAERLAGVSPPAGRRSRT